MARNEKVSTFLKDCLADALVERMKYKPFDKITVDEIVETSGVGRATYFRHFSSKQELLTYKIVRHWEINSEQRNMTERHKFDINNAVDFFEINYLNKDVLDIIYSTGLQSTLLDAFYKIMISEKSENTLEQYHERFYSYGLFGALDEWIRNGYKETPQQMAEILTQITKL